MKYKRNSHMGQEESNKINKNEKENNIKSNIPKNNYKYKINNENNSIKRNSQNLKLNANNISKNNINNNGYQEISLFFQQFQSQKESNQQFLLVLQQIYLSENFQVQLFQYSLLALGVQP